MLDMPVAADVYIESCFIMNQTLATLTACGFYGASDRDVSQLYLEMPETEPGTLCVQSMYSNVEPQLCVKSVASLQQLECTTLTTFVLEDSSYCVSL